MEILGRSTISPFCAASRHQIAVFPKKRICRIFTPSDMPHLAPERTRPARQNLPRDTPHPDRRNWILNKK
nr:MAG TPA: hypothetical protein [Caudoviricetes sp.]